MFKEKYYKHFNDKFLKRSKKQVEKIREYLDSYKSLSEKELKDILYTECIVHRPDRLEKVYALASVVIERELGLSLYDVQLQGAIALYENNLLEMKTGEGKSVTSVLPVILRALDGQVHVCTVNEYLARRDKELFEKVYNFFDLSVALNLQSDDRALKKEHYACNIIYGTGSTFGFDYLYNNMVQSVEDKIDIKYDTVLIDEVDLILIDESRTPLVVGGQFSEDRSNLIKIDKVVKQLEKEHYVIDKKDKNVYLTELGNEFVCEHLNDSLYSKDNILLAHQLKQSLLANFVYEYDVDYTIKEYDGEKLIVIIDTYTGRVQKDRRFGDGLHSALEVKHLVDGVKFKDETRTVATITLQNYFKKYNNLSGMSGTLVEEREEFKTVYNKDIIELPTNKPKNLVIERTIYKEDKVSKFYCVVDTALAYHNANYPVLIGTLSVEDSESISKLLTEFNLEHVVLNAKQDKDEAEIIAKAGRKGAITVATNMAGRGTDIIVEDENYPLVVIVTELSESSRIDNQLKGRTARQGAKGIVKEILSLEDLIFQRTNTVRKRGIEKIDKVLQSELESQNAYIRSNSLKYDEIIGNQRESFYKTRDKVLNSENIDDMIKYFGFDIKLLNDRGFDLEQKRSVLMLALDRAWVTHLDNLSQLKNGIGWRGYSGVNSFIIYQEECIKLYNKLNDLVLHNLQKIEENMRRKEIEEANAYKEKVEKDDII